MNKFMSMIRTLLVGIGIIVFLAMWCILQTQKAQVVYVQNPNCIPSVMEIQQRLKDLDNPRYNPGKVDGIPGKMTVTAWDNHTCDRYAKGE